MLEKYDREMLSEECKIIAGCDEAGRGPLAGPVVVGACIMPLNEGNIIEGVNDSKKLTEKKREELYEKIIEKAICYSIIEVDNILKEIDVLPEIYKDILLLKVEYGYKDREIAKLLGIKVDTVSKRLERARKQLKKQLNEGGSSKWRIITTII